MSEPGAEAYPAAPWRMHGDLWLTLWWLPRAVDELRPRGVYGAAFVTYRSPSPLTYAELLVARPRNRRASITDIWVDSPASRRGGRELWAIPKELAAFRRAGSTREVSWAASRDGVPVAAARFADLGRPLPRLPFRGGTWQPDPGGRGQRTAPVRGTCRPAAVRAHWDLAAAGPLAWLRGARPLGSLRLRDFAMSFG